MIAISIFWPEEEVPPLGDRTILFGRAMEEQEEGVRDTQASGIRDMPQEEVALRVPEEQVVIMDKRATNWQEADKKAHWAQEAAADTMVAAPLGVLPVEADQVILIAV